VCLDYVEELSFTVIGVAVPYEPWPTKSMAMWKEAFIGGLGLPTAKNTEVLYLVCCCSQVLFKLEKDGRGQEIDRKNLGANGDLSFENWTDDMVS